MFFRVDYALAMLFVGLVTGVRFSKRAQNIAPSRLGCGYYAAVAVVTSHLFWNMLPSYGASVSCDRWTYEIMGHN
jgi:hypothetical protein